jgi:hypothetical protein
MSWGGGGVLLTMPGYPPAPESFSVSLYNIVAQTTSVFTGQQQIYDWQNSYLVAEISMPAMIYTDAQAWTAWLKSLVGPVNVFQFSAAFMAAYPNDFPGSVYWRLTQNTSKWSVTRERVYGISFNCRQAI